MSQILEHSRREISTGYIIEEENKQNSSINIGKDNIRDDNFKEIIIDWATL